MRETDAQMVGPPCRAGPGRRRRRRPRHGDGGVRVKKVIEGSVAEAAGLAPDDLIREAAGVAVSKTSDLIAIVRRQAPGTWLPLRVRRGAETVDIVARFPPRP